ncbi:hypothetical protein DJ84_18435 [Halorubrum ezzemoulense]|nr:hypothetical protein DJ84_18435 [Halorubrum ezzemoulense]
MWLKHESGEATELRNSQVLGDNSPLEFDEDGYAEVDDQRGSMLLTMHRHIERGGHGPPGAGDDEEDDVDDLDGESGTLPFNPDAKTIAGIETEIADIDDVTAVRALKNLEAEQQDRSGAEDVFDDRLAELEEEE